MKQARIKQITIKNRENFNNLLGDSKYLKLESENLMSISIEYLGEKTLGGNIMKEYSIACYGEQNGDLMADPEVVFLIPISGIFIPYYYKNDYLGVEQVAIKFEENLIALNLINSIVPMLNNMIGLLKKYKVTIRE